MKLSEWHKNNIRNSVTKDDINDHLERIDQYRNERQLKKEQQSQSLVNFR